MKITNISLIFFSFFFFVDISISFLSINEIKRKLKGKKLEKRKIYFVHMLFRKT